MTAVEDCVVIGLESFPMGLSVWVAGNTVYAQMHARAWHIEAFANLRLLVPTYYYYYCYCYVCSNSVIRLEI